MGPFYVQLTYSKDTELNASLADLCSLRSQLCCDPCASVSWHISCSLNVPGAPCDLRPMSLSPGFPGTLFPVVPISSASPPRVSVHCHPGTPLGSPWDWRRVAALLFPTMSLLLGGPKPWEWGEGSMVPRLPATGKGIRLAVHAG